MARRRRLTGLAVVASASTLLLTWLMPLTARADAAAGERLAHQWCVNCHVVPGGTARATVPQGPPSFPAIAQHLDAGALRAFLSHPHKPMPDLALTRAEIDDLVAYIETLK
jgi:mono/diheme cytochrome c family protein